MRCARCEQDLERPECAPSDDCVPMATPLLHADDDDDNNGSEDGGDDAGPADARPQSPSSFSEYSDDGEDIYSAQATPKNNERIARINAKADVWMLGLRGLEHKGNTLDGEVLSMISQAAVAIQAIATTMNGVEGEEEEVSEAKIASSRELEILKNSAQKHLNMALLVQSHFQDVYFKMEHELTRVYDFVNESMGKLCAMVRDRSPPETRRSLHQEVEAQIKGIENQYIHELTVCRSLVSEHTSHASHLVGICEETLKHGKQFPHDSLPDTTMAQVPAPGFERYYGMNPPSRKRTRTAALDDDDDDVDVAEDGSVRWRSASPSP